MIIAVDAMGGDYAPKEIIAGAIDAKEKLKIHICLVGQSDIINEHLHEIGIKEGIQVVHASEVIGMDEHPGTAIRRKKDSSIVVATRLVKEKKADAVVSAGSTGAQMAAALFGLGRIKEVERPAIVTVLPAKTGRVVLLDAGANADSKPKHLVQFAKMGSIYAEKILSFSNPKVALLNIGAEETKGNELTIESYKLLQDDVNINFLGNIEGRDLLEGHADVIVCDGFVGNVVLKFAEGLAGTMFSLIKEELEKSLPRKVGALLAMPAFKAIKQKLDYNEYGGAPLLGIDGVSIICHGSSKAKAITNAVAVAKQCVESDLIGKIKEAI
ncbi:MAG: phosphate acyltransferase PlsX [Bacillota bacterium]|nr:phosphate acyltransferase PlsX [Bacillota bacterium]